MNRIKFEAARIFAQEQNLAAMSHPLPTPSGLNVALVGNARAMAKGTAGNHIDKADLVARINRAPMPSSESHGTRTDWLALVTSISQAELQRLQPRCLLWMSHKRKRLSYNVATHPRFYLHTLEDWHRLKDQLGAPPSTGAMMIDLFARSKAATITLYGFDFFASKSLTGSRDATQVPHDFAAEAVMVDALLTKDRRFSLMMP